MNKLSAWISAARLRTLPLSVSGIIVGSSIGNRLNIEELITSGDLSIASFGSPYFFKTKIFWLAIATTLGLQILSNFANDYGDGVKGTDNEDRVGPERALQSGAISKKEMLIGIVITALISFALAMILIYTSFGEEYFYYTIIFSALGLAAIAAAIKYTVGKSAYGYRGMGDIFVFVFFGIVSVVGCFFLYTKFIYPPIFLPAITIGLLSAAVLNLNNMRDYYSDKKSNKNTLVVKMGIINARKYHIFLIVMAMLSMIFFMLLEYRNPKDLLFGIAFIPLIIHIKKVVKTDNTELLDPELKKVALTTFLLSILFSLSQIL
ncbi:1,4-dihydroxy-2-naphthoate octaprenyltransferase [Aquimarina mytili]|uniref:1,4-dihydroxy-2-naphthoate octaprenyltransferase n=1 Tax=Aquimarina mytili TaxID=874423 RepID=A0A937A270_9FLAO|nr:1,4-dihydroxy-2-naphthoate octaprenyltransferase [Aquimarina mytili]MBL0685516.1 1,4-dihydroxy-2-naphthoate octaprenyltransferase [Aquimarina mytili]